MPGRHVRRWQHAAGRHVRDALLNLVRAGFQVMLMVLALLTGATGLWRPERITSPVDPLLPEWGRFVWYAGLFVGSVVVLVGIVLAWPLGSRVERAGLIVLLGSCLSYTYLAVSAGVATAAAIVLLFVLVLASRIWLIWWEPREIAAALKLLRRGVR